MIIPIRCMNCGGALANMWRWFQRRVAELNKQMGNTNATGPAYMDGTSVPVTAERQAMEELGLTRYCCRKHFLTNRDLIDKV
jgi:DNA-directed RNA polymerase I, II, and III subunit RPABC5